MEGTGAISVDSIMKAIQPNTILVTVMLANNETGAIQVSIVICLNIILLVYLPVREICEAIGKYNEVHSPSRVLVHTDAAQVIFR